MGNNVYAHLVYGFPVLNDDGDALAENNPPKWLLENPEGDESDMLDIGDVVARLENIQPPTEDFDKENEVLAKYEAYWEAKRQAEKKYGVVLVEHCQAKCTMWILGVDESHKSEWRGEVNRLGQKIEAKPEWHGTLKTFCDRAGIPFSEPEWLLAPFSE